MDTTTRDAAPSRLPNPALLMQLALAHRSSAVLFAAADLDVFTILSTGPKTAIEVASAAGAHDAPMQMLLQACANEGLLTQDADRYTNTPLVDAFLVRGRPAFS